MRKFVWMIILATGFSAAFAQDVDRLRGNPGATGGSPPKASAVPEAEPPEDISDDDLYASWINTLPASEQGAVAELRASDPARNASKVMKMPAEERRGFMGHIAMMPETLRNALMRQFAGLSPTTRKNLIKAMQTIPTKLKVRMLHVLSTPKLRHVPNRPLGNRPRLAKPGVQRKP